MLLIAVFSQYFFGLTIFITSLFLVMLVLVQRGRGGGLTGALGGAGGQSAFGTKAGDLFTRITVGVAAVWIALCAAAVFFLKDRALPDTGFDNANTPTLSSPREPGGAAATLTPADSPPSAPVTNTPAETNPAGGASPDVVAPLNGSEAGVAPSANAPATEGAAASDGTENQPPSAENGEPAASADNSATTPADSTP